MQLFRATNLVSDALPERTLPTPAPGRGYVGFAIGPDSEHDRVLLRTSRGQFSVIAGSPIALDLPVGERPVVTAVRLGGVALAQLFAAECPAELVALPNRRADYQVLAQTQSTTGSFATIATLPFAGRRRATFYVTNTGGTHSLNFKVLGRLFYGTGASDYEEATLVSTTSLSNGSSSFKVIGGYDEAEDYDVLLLQTQSNSGDTTARALGRAWGELSD